MQRLKGLRGRAGLLGWVLAGMLAVAAGGTALAATVGHAGPAEQTATTQTTVKARALGHGHWGRFGRRALHGQVTVQTNNGTRTYVFARGKVSALSGSSIAITSSDNATTTFAINASTQYGTRRIQQSRSDVKVGVQAAVLGQRSGASTAATWIAVVRQDAAGKAGNP